jgi:hypothetical protein
LIPASAEQTGPAVLGEERKERYEQPNAAFDYLDHPPTGGFADLALQHRLGILSQRRPRVAFAYFDHSSLV